MGMSASQARFLSLTARKTNVEYEGQQINQQRTTLSNESSSYYSRLTNMDVPTPPSSSDYTKISYTFTDGSETNTINSLIATKDGSYILNYTRETLEESVVSNGSVMVTRQIADDGSKTYYVGASKLRALGQDSNDDAYLKTLTDKEKADALVVENQYLSMLQDKYKDKEWYVKYQYNSTTKGYSPVFYSAQQIENADYSEKTGSSLSSIKSYAYGQSTESVEVRNQKARVEQDSTGRYKSIYIYQTDDEGNIQTDDDGNPLGYEYTLDASSATDDAAYNDAMNKYHYDKSLYEQEVQAINSKIEIIQQQDKDLELRLKQLDTEENAISTEMEAVKKVISKNVESTFKTFNA